MEEMIYKRLMADCFGPRSVAIYGGAYHLEKQGKTSLQDIAEGIARALHTARFFGEKPSQVARNFCSIFLVDPMIMEAYLGIRLSELDNVQV